MDRYCQITPQKAVPIDNSHTKAVLVFALRITQYDLHLVPKRYFHSSLYLPLCELAFAV